MDRLVRYEDVKHQTTEDYFRGNQFSIDAFNKKYAAFEGETYVQALKRVCEYVASVEETKELRKYWAERWFDEIYNDWWHPSGSIMQGAGSNRKISLANCTTVSLGTICLDEEWDNLESIIRNTTYTVAKCAAHRQGLGVDFSRLRPRDMEVYNSSRKSCGAVHWMKLVDSIGYYVGQKGRIPAMLFSISCSHPDLVEFIKAKSDFNSIQNANISVQCTEKFYEAVEKDLDWELAFDVPRVVAGQKIYVDVESATSECLKDKDGRFYYIARQSRPAERIVRKEKARYLLELIAKHMFERAEPGIQNIDLARRYSNSDYVYDPNDEYDSRIISTNAPLVGETLVPTPAGIIPIKDLYAKSKHEVLSDSIVTLPSGLIDWKTNKSTRYLGRSFPTKTFPVMARFRKYEQQTVWEVELSDGKIFKCNGEHKWLVNGEMVATKDLKVDDKLFRPNGGIVQACGYTVDFAHKDFQLGEVIGYVVGDGWVGKASGVHNRMIGIVYDEDCRHFADSFRSLYSQVTGDQLEFERNRGKIFEVRTEKKAFVEYFEQFGIGESKYSIPSRCFTDLHFCAGFLRGLYQADGYVRWDGRNGNIVLTTVCPQVAKGVMSLLSNWFGIHCTIKRARGRGVKYGDGKISNARDRYDVTISAEEHLLRFKEHIGLLGKKGETLNTIYCTGKRRTNRTNLTVTKVLKTEQCEDMYCAQIDGLHAFVADGCMSSNCSEQYLSRESLCVLASQNAGKFSTNEEAFEEEQARIASSMNRFLDNVNEAELRYKTYATPHQKLAIEKLRRTGAGFTNMVAWLFKQNISYGTPEAVEAVRYYTERFNYHLYKQSIETGREKGSFGLFNQKKLEKSPFIKRMVNLGLKFDALRNVTCSSIAPTGTLSLMFRDEVMSYGAEPAFGMYYWKRTRISGKYEYYFCVPAVVQQVFAERGFPIPLESDTVKDTWDGKIGRPVAEFIERHKDEVGIRFRKPTEVSPFEKLDMMSAMMENIDSSISITYLLPENTDWKDVYNFILQAHKKGVKSIAAFPDRQMYGIVTLEPFKDLAKRLTKAGIKIHAQNFSAEELAQLGGQQTEETIVKNNAPRRPEQLACDIHHMTISGKPWFVVLGLLAGEPYEVFCTDNTHMHYTNDDSILLSKKHQHGLLKKMGRGEYYLLSTEGEKLLPSSLSGLLNSEHEAVTRMVSTSLRHGADIKYVVEQLSKVKGDLSSFSKCLARALKKYIKDGSRVSGEDCPQCGQQLVFAEGCKNCPSCGWSKCS